MQLTTESLESRSMLALTIDLVGGVLQVTQDANPDATVGVVFSTQTFAGGTGPVQASAIRITGNTAGGSPIATGTNLPFNDPVTGLPQITGISLVMQQSATEVVVTDQLAGITNVTGGAIWTVSYAIGGGTGGSSTASGSVAITNPSRLLVATAAGVEIDGDFTANDGYLRVAPREATIGKTTPVQADDVTITTSAGTKAIAMQGGITATNSITLATDALLNVTGNISAPSVTLDVAAGATQATTGGTVTAASLTLASGAGVTFSNSANAIGNIASITAAGQDIVIKTSGTVSQTGAILARSLQLEATGAVTLTNLANDLDQLGISSSGAIQYVDGDSVQLGVNGLGVQALGGNSVTLTTTGALTQGASGRVRAGTFTANINTSGGGNDNLLLNSANNEVARFVANNTSAGGDITFLNAAVGGVLTLGDGVGAGVTAINGDITITNTGEGITVASPVSAGLLGSISLTSTGAISQNAAPVAATLTAKTLTVVNNDATGAVTLGLANEVRSVAITNNATASGGITFKGSTATTGSLVIGVGGVGVTASGGTVTIDANNRKLIVDAAITVGGGGDVVLVADGGVSQSNTAAITADDLTVTNTTAGVVALESPTNDVANLVISNKVASGTVRYVDLNDLALQAGGGIQAGDSITLKVGGAFVSTPGNVLAVTGPTGSVSLTTDGTATLGGAVTGTTGVTVAAGTATKVSDVSVNAALTGGAGPVDIKATGAVASSPAGTISGSSVTLDGAKNVTLAAAVNAVTGGIVVNSASGALVTAAAATLTAAAGVTSTTQGSATFGGAVTAPSINVVAGVAPALSSIGVNGVFTATGGVSLAATDAITTAATITAASVTAQSGGATTLGGKVTSTGGAVNFTAGGTFTANSDLADILSAGVATVTSKGAMSLAGSVSGTQVTLTAGTPTSGAAINLLDTVDSTAGQLKIEAVGGAVTTGVKATTTATGGDLSISGTAGVTLGAAATSSAANIAIAATAGAVAVNQVSATAGTVTLAAANGVTQAAKTGIQALALEVTNSTAGSITLSEPANSVDSFAAANAAPGGKVVFRNSKDVTLAGVSAANGPIDLTVGGKIAVDGAINAGTGDVAVTASGEVSQSPTATILATNLKVNTTVGDILLGFAANDVDFLSGANGAASGKFEFTDADDIQLATPLTPLTTNGGDITVASGKSGVGPMTIGGTVDAGDGFISLQAAGGITGLASHAITSGTGLQLANNTSGDIDLTSRGNAFPTLSAVTAPGGNISLYDALSVTLEKHVTTAGTTAGLSAVGGVIKLTVDGGVDQTSTAPVIAKDATFLTEGDVTLDVSSTNDVANLAIQNTGLFSPVSYTDANDLAIGVGTNGVVTLLADITLESLGGAITLNGLVSNGGGSTTTLRASGAITQPAASITSGNLVMASGTDIFVERPGNTISNLRAFALNELRFRNAADFEVGLNRTPVAPVPATATVTVDATGVATFSEPFVVPMAGPDRPLQAGDVLVINGLPYRVKSVIGLTAELIAADGTPDEYPAGTSFTVLTPQEIEVRATEVYLNSVIGGIRVTAGIVGEMTLTAAGFVEYVVSNTQDVGGGSLRQMIGYSNVNRGARTVNGIPLPQPMRMVFDEFLYPVQDIFITSALPAVVNPLNIIGERVEVNVTDYERVGIDGTGVTATSIVHGIRYAAGSQGSSVSGLAVYGFATGGGFRIVSGLNTFVNNYAGVRRDGTTLTANKMGFEFSGRTATSNTVGTYVVDEALANVIGGNSFAGIVARNGATANAIVGNYIGTDAVGSDLGNLGDGIVFEAVNGNIVGARTAILPDGTPAASNVIANNNASGVRIAGARAATTALGNLIENNRIRDNAINGIEITGSTFQSVGGAQLRQANIITGQFTGSGVRVAQSADVSVVANYIGVDAVGTSGLGNAASGVMIDGSVRTLVNAGNRIASNGTGVTIRNGSIETRVEGNWIGTDSAGSALGNVGDGVLIDRSVGNFVRQGNTISNNGANGVNITDSTAAALAQGNFVTGNLIAGNGNVGSGTGAGIRVSGGARHSLGQTGVGNVITANAGEGIRVDRSPLTGSSVGIMIQANFIGTNANEESDPTLGNGVGIRLSRASAATVNGRNVVANNVQDGVVLEGTVRSQVGGANAGTGNVITGNGGNGVTITNVVGTGSVVNSGNNVYGNEITANGGAGVVVRGVTTNGASTTSNVVVGVRTIPGQAPVGAANVISGNAGNGVTIDGAQSVLVQGNSIFENGGVPIALLNNGNLGAAAPTLTRAVLVQRSNSLTQVVVDGTFAQTGTGRVTVNNGTATFNVAQPSLKAGSVVVINGTGYSVAEKVSNTVFRLAGNPTLTTAGVGRVSAKSGVATFSVPQSAAIVGRAIVVAGRSYTVSNLSANGRTASLSGAPTFAVSGFSLLQPQAFNVVDATVLNQQFVVDIFLNAPADGNPTTGAGYGMRTFVGRATVTVGPTGTGAFSATVNLPAGVSAVGQYVTATATTLRASALASAFSTSPVSSRARQLVFASAAT